MARYFGLKQPFFFFGLLALLPAAEATLHGADDRKNFFEVRDPLVASFADSIAVEIHSHLLFDTGDTRTRKIMGIPFERQHALCDGEKFANENTVGAGGCSAFLVSDDVLVTAGHCFREKDRTAEEICADRLWVFGVYAKSPRDLEFDPIPGNQVFELSKKSWNSVTEIYRCKEVLFAPPPAVHGIDAAIFRLDRPTRGRKAFEFRKEGRLATDASLVTIGGSQQGFLKFSENGKLVETPEAERVHQRDSIFFRSTLDVFVGNSGGPVFDARTGIVEGILAGAAKASYESDPSRASCSKALSFPEKDGLTYSVRMSVIAPVLEEILGPSH